MKSLISSLLAAAALPASAVTLYQKNFELDTASNPITTTNTSLSEVGWNGYMGSTSGITDDQPSSSQSHRVGVLRGGSGPNGSDAANNSYLFAQNGTGGTAGTDYFFYTSTAVTGSGFTAFAPSSYTSLTAEWTRNSSNFTTGGYYFAIETGGTWYVSTVNHRTASSGGIPLNLLTTTWNPLNLSTAGAGSMSVDTATTLSYATLFGAGQSVTGIGFYVDDLAVPTSGTNTLRIDDILIQGVPEAASGLLGMMGLSFLCLRRRK